jgi:hypothetical protein
LNDARPGLGYRWRQFAPARITDHERFWPSFDFSPETVSVKPIDPNQQVKLIRKTVDRMIRQAKEAGSLATPNLGA